MGYYGIPVVSYRDAVWPSMRPPPDFYELWSGLSHPEIGSHLLVAQTVLFSLLSLQQNETESALERRNAMRRFEGARPGMESTTSERVQALLQAGTAAGESICRMSDVATGTAYDAIGNPDASDAFYGFPALYSGCGWQYREDRPEKPGWIVSVSRAPAGCRIEKSGTQANTASTNTASTNSTTIAFSIAFGRKRLVQVMYLASYDRRMGQVLVWFAGEAPQDSTHAAAAEGVESAERHVEGQYHSSVKILGGNARSSPVVINGHHNETDTSTPQVAFIRPSNNATIQNNRTVIHFGLIEGAKFKLLGLSAC